MSNILPTVGGDITFSPTLKKYFKLSLNINQKVNTCTSYELYPHKYPYLKGPFSEVF